MASSTTHNFPLATETYFPSDGVGSVDGDGAVDHGIDDAAGAAGEDPGVTYLPQGALIAIIVIAVVIALVGIGMAVLFYVAKKREWKMREKLRQSARRVVNALTPRRSEFPKEVKNAHRGRKGIRLDDVPPTPRLTPEDIEKGLSVNISSEGRKKKWGRNLT